MIKKSLLGIFLLAFPAFSIAQSLSIRTLNNSGANNASTFNLDDAKVSFETNRIRFLSSGKTFSGTLAYGISADESLVAILSGRDSDSKVTLASSTGDSVSSFNVTDLSAGDPSIAVYLSNSGTVLVRDNIANFNFYDSFGDILKNLSGSSQSEGGEAISEVALNPTSQTVVIYTPKIKRGSNLGSQIQYVDEGMNLKSLFASNDRFIKKLSVTKSGQFAAFITSKEGANDMVHVTDKFGNEIMELSSEENLAGLSLAEDASFVTAYSGKRALVFNTLTKERTGSTSFSSNVVKATYFPEDNTILAMTGNYNDDSGVANGVEFHAVNVAERKVERKEYSSALHFNKALGLGFTRTGNNQYRLSGANKMLELRVAF